MKILVKIKHLLQRAWLQTGDFPRNCRNFNFKVACWIWWDRVFLGIGKTHYIAAIQEYMDNFLCDLADKYRKMDLNLPAEPKVTKVWCCWWQGEENMREIVRVCVNSIKKATPEYVDFQLITAENYHNFIELPSYITDKFTQGHISLAHYSDILRFALLSKYGGFWIDATILVTSPIPADCFTAPYFTQRYPDASCCPKEACLGKWAGFLQCGLKENLLFQFMFEALCLWWNHFDYVIDYVMFDYILMTGYKSVSQFRVLIDGVQVNNCAIWEMERLLPAEFDAKIYSDLCNRNTFHKLARTLAPAKTTNGQDTVYGHICKKYGV